MSHSIKPGVATGDEVQVIFNYAKEKGFALPAVNVTTTSTVNGVMETAAKLKAPVIIQFSNGGALYFAGKGLSNQDEKAAILGGISGAKHVHALAEAYGATVILHTDHCAKKLLPWIDGLLDAGEQFYKETGKPLYSSHMIDLSEEPIAENIEICKQYLARMSKIGMTLEIELGITGGEEDGVDNTDVDSAKLYTQPEEVAYAYEELMKISPRFTIAAAFAAIQIGVISSQQFTAAGGGIVPGMGSGMVDSVPSMLAPGETVINAQSSSMYPELLNSINMAGGGISLKPDLPGINKSDSEVRVFGDNKVNQPIRAFVVETDVTDTQKRVNRIKRSAEF